MGFPAVEGLSRARIQRYAGEVGLLAFAAGYGFGQIGSADWGDGIGFYTRCAIVVALLLVVGIRFRRVPAGSTAGTPVPHG